MPRTTATLTITINGREFEATEGESVLDVARREGIRIPTLCHLEGLSVWGSCRLCLVELADTNQLRPACATAATEDLEVTTDTPRIHEYRRMIVELLLAEGNHVCAVCVSNGACELQDLAAELGVDHVRYDYLYPQRNVDATHPRYLFDPNRCVLCTRCVRTCDEVEGAHVWDVASRGHQAYLVTDLHRPWGDADSCTWCGKCVASCPTGALGFKGSSVAEMRHDPGVVAFLTTARREGEWSRQGPER